MFRWGIPGFLTELVTATLSSRALASWTNAWLLRDSASADSAWTGQLTTDHADQYRSCGRPGAETKRWRSVAVGTYGGSDARAVLRSPSGPATVGRLAAAYDRSRLVCPLLRAGSPVSGHWPLPSDPDHHRGYLDGVERRGGRLEVRSLPVHPAQPGVL